MKPQIFAEGVRLGISGAYGKRKNTCNNSLPNIKLNDLCENLRFHL
ncbi:MAG: hypothetical protein JNN28_13440 [Saprospiraceae bacterium]|nr:hypothetical protein [Saprospiraceae bacterium]